MLAPSFIATSSAKHPKGDRFVIYTSLCLFFLPLFVASFVIYGFARRIFVSMNLVNELALAKKYELEEDDTDDE